MVMVMGGVKSRVNRVGAMYVVIDACTVACMVHLATPGHPLLRLATLTTPRYTSLYKGSRSCMLY